MSDPKLPLKAECKDKMDYTLGQFLAEVKYREQIISTLEKMTNVIEKLDKRISELEDAKR